MTVRRWREKIEVSPSLSPGATHRVPFVAGLGATERDGRPVHLLGLEFEVSVTYNVENNGGGAALPGIFTRAVLRNIEIKSGDHSWVDNLDGDEVHFLSELRRGAIFDPIGIDATTPAAIEIPDADGTYDAEEADLINELKARFNELRAVVDEMRTRLFNLTALGTPGDPPDIEPENVQGAQRTVTIRYLCSELGSSPWDGAIPVHLLDERKGANGITFQVASSFKGNTNYAPTSVVVTTYAILCTRDELRIPTPHKMRAYDEPRKDFRVTPDGRAIALVIRDTTLANGSVVTTAPVHDHYAGITITNNNEVLFKSFSVPELIDELNLRAAPGERRYPTSQTPFLPIYVARRGEKRTSMHSGTMRVEIQTRADAANTPSTNSRVLVHETGRNTSPLMANFKRILGAPMKPGEAPIQPRFAVKGTRTADHPVADILDHAIYWAGMPARVPRQKLADVAQRRYGKAGAVTK